MKIDRQLNLVRTIETENGVYHVHSAPISHAVWEENFFILSQAYTSIFSGGFGATTGPKMAALMLKRCATKNGAPEEYTALMNEIKRLTNVTFSTPQGWRTMPWESAAANIDEEAVAEAENAIVFFICVSAVLRGKADKAKLDITLAMMASLWDAQTTSLGITEYAASLPISTQDAPSIESKPASSVVY